MAAVAPMDLVVKTEAGSIPLRCSICPKKPNFSDLSHLLTHISSKSHLAHRFKVELKARADRDALEAVRQYEDWCERYGINALLAERMTAKEQKRTSRRGRPSNAAAAAVSFFPHIFQLVVHWLKLNGRNHRSGLPNPWQAITT